MSVEDEVVAILQSRDGPEDVALDAVPEISNLRDIANLRDAVREVQEAVVHVARQLDELRET